MIRNDENDKRNNPSIESRVFQNSISIYLKKCNQRFYCHTSHGFVISSQSLPFSDILYVCIISHNPKWLWFEIGSYRFLFIWPKSFCPWFSVLSRGLKIPTTQDPNHTKDWINQLFLIPGLIWSGKRFHLWMWSLWDSEQPFSCVLGLFRHGDNQPTKPGDPSAIRVVYIILNLIIQNSE